MIRSAKHWFCRKKGFHEAVEALEKRMIAAVLEQTHWHRGKTAEKLGIPRKTLQRNFILSNSFVVRDMDSCLRRNDRGARCVIPAKAGIHVPQYTER